MTNEFDYIPLPEPAPISEQHWPEGTVPLVHTRTMTFNHKAYIRECIDGILMQKTTFPVQVLIHDDASTDGTAEIVREYAEKFPYVVKAFCQPVNTYRHPDKRELRAEFVGWCVGKYGAPCEGDDYWTDPNKLQKQVAFLERNPECGMTHTEVSCKNEMKKEYIARLHESKGVLNDNLENIDLQLLTGRYLVSTPTVVLRNDLWEKIRAEYAEDFGSQFMMGDIQTWFHMARVSRIHYFSQPTAVYRMHETSACQRSLPEKELPFAWNCFQMYMHLAESYDIPPATKATLIEQYGRWVWGLCVRARSFQHGLDIAKRIIAEEPFGWRRKWGLLWQVFGVGSKHFMGAVVKKTVQTTSAGECIR